MPRETEDGTEDFNLAMKGKDLLDNGEYEKAIKLFRSLLDKDDSLVFVKNNLALAYYCNKELDLAIEISGEVLEEYPSNVHANCNMAIFCHEKEDEARMQEAVNKILRINHQGTRRRFHKICITFCELGMHQDAQRMLKQLSDLLRVRQEGAALSGGRTFQPGAVPFGAGLLEPGAQAGSPEHGGRILPQSLQPVHITGNAAAPAFISLPGSVRRDHTAHKHT